MPIEEQIKKLERTLNDTLPDSKQEEEILAQIDLLKSRLKKRSEEEEADRGRQRVQIYIPGEISSLSEERRTTTINVIAAALEISPEAINVYHVYEGSIVFDLGIPSKAVQRLRSLLQSNSEQLHQLNVEKILLENESGEIEEWVIKKGKFQSIITYLKNELSCLLEDFNYQESHEKTLRYKELVTNLENRLLKASFDSSELQAIINKLKGIEQYIERINQQVDEIEFVNRLNEIEFITNIYCPLYLLVNAPMGYGKTRLLKAVKDILQKGWLNIHIELSRCTLCSFPELTRAILDQAGRPCGQEDVSTPERVGHVIGIRLLSTLNATHKNVLILLDNIECLSEDVTEQFLNQCLPAIQEVLSNGNRAVQLRTIFAGRHITHWKQISSTIPLELMALTPFDFSAVHQTVENFDVKNHRNMAPEFKRDFAAYLMYFTGGHPGCMAKILHKDFGFPIQLLVSNEPKDYNEIIAPVIRKIKTHIPDELKKIFETLSVVRRFNPRFLRHFIEKKLIKWPKSEYELESLLLQTYLVSKDSGFLKDDITRRLLAIRLRKTNLDYFLKVCMESISFYGFQLKSLKSHRPVILTIELLFQTLQFLAYSPHNNSKELFFEILPEILNILVSERDSPQDIIDSFIELLKEDREFRFSFNYLLKENIYNDEYPFNELIRKIENFRENLERGGSNNA